MLERTRHEIRVGKVFIESRRFDEIHEVTLLLILLFKHGVPGNTSPSLNQRSSPSPAVTNRSDQMVRIIQKLGITVHRTRTGSGSGSGSGSGKNTKQNKKREEEQSGPFAVTLSKHR